MGHHGTLMDKAAHKPGVQACLHGVEVAVVADPQRHLAVEGNFLPAFFCLVLLVLLLVVPAADIDEGASLAL